jgi:protein ImuB
MFAAIRLPRFRLQAALRWREEVPAAVALVDGDIRRGQILELSDAAAASQVEPGMAPAQALARCPELSIILRAPAQEAACRALLLGIAREFSPRVEATADGVCTVDLTGAPRSVCWQRLGEDIVARCAEEGLQARAGLARHPEHAWLAACQAVPVNVVYDGARFSEALPLTALDPSPELCGVLADWGIRTVGQFLELPKEAVIERLGPEAAALRNRVTGQSRRVLRLAQEPEEYVETYEFEGGIETTEPLLFLLRRFADGLSRRLRNVHRVAEGMELALPLDGAPEYRRTFTIPAPTAEADVWFRILSTHLESLTLEHQPTGVWLRIQASDPANRQLHLFENSLRDPNRFGETLAQLKAVAGEACVGVPQPMDTHRPGAFRMEEFAELASGEPVESRRKGLPLRRYRPARPAQVRLVNNAPTWMQSPGVQGVVERVAGPYCVSGDWWEAAPWTVEEWDVQLADGAGLLRLAKWPGGRWTLEGAYDVC